MARRTLEIAFAFRELEWVPSGEAAAARLEERIRNRSVDWVLVLRSFVGHGVANRLFDSAKAAGVQFLLIEQGYGATRIAEAFRERLAERGERAAG